jgi:hypothetical protein
MYRIASCSGTTSIANENIIPQMLLATSESTRIGKGAMTPFIARKVVFYCDTNTVIYVNTSDQDMALNLNQTIVRETFPGSGEYSIATNIGDVLITKFVIATPGTVWTMTFLF